MCCGSRSWSLFQSTHPRGVRPVKFDGAFQNLKFQSTHPRGVRPTPATSCWCGILFQSTHPRGVRPQLPASRARASSSFNPRTRVGCDGVTPVNLHAIVRVSIHAPAWGATSHTRLLAMATTCFNPRTRVGCDRIPSPLAPLAVRFQSTHPRGVRRTAAARSRAGELVSIHAPAWGATWIWYQYGIRFEMFQSTHPRGVRHAGHGRIPCAGPVSIHAPAWGATTPSGRPLAPGTGFQSTHPRGVRLALPLDHDRLALVSIHAPAWGATSQRPKGGQRSRVSIHAPAWGATCPCEVRRLAKSLFQSTHPRGVRLGISPSGFNATGVSIHAPAWGATLVVTEAVHRVGPVSIHAPAWGATAVDGLPERPVIGFNPRTRVGCDLQGMQICRGVKRVSIHAPAWGATALVSCQI